MSAFDKVWDLFKMASPSRIDEFQGKGGAPFVPTWFLMTDLDYENWSDPNDPNISMPEHVREKMPNRETATGRRYFWDSCYDKAPQAPFDSESLSHPDNFDPSTGRPFHWLEEIMMPSNTFYRLEQMSKNPEHDIDEYQQILDDLVHQHMKYQAKQRTFENDYR